MAFERRVARVPIGTIPIVRASTHHGVQASAAVSRVFSAPMLYVPAGQISQPGSSGVRSKPGVQDALHSALQPKHWIGSVVGQVSPPLLSSAR